MKSTLKGKALDNGWEAMQAVMKDYTIAEQIGMKRGILQNMVDLWLFGADMDSSTKYILSKITDYVNFGIFGDIGDMESLEVSFNGKTRTYYRPIYSKKIRKRLGKRLAKIAKLASKEEAEKKKLAERRIKQAGVKDESNSEGQI